MSLFCASRTQTQNIRLRARARARVREIPGSDRAASATTLKQGHALLRLERIQARVLRLLEKRGLLEVGADDSLATDAPALSACYEGAVTQRVGLGPMRGRPVIKLGMPLAKHLATARERVQRGGMLCGHVDGFQADSRLAGHRDANTRRSETWAELMRLTFGLDVLSCPRCGGRLKHVATILDGRAARRILEHVGRPARAPPELPACDPPPFSPVPADAWE